MGFLAPLAGAALGLAGSVFSSKQAASGQRSANTQNAQQAELNRQFQAEQARLQYRRYKKLRNTSYRAAMKDMKRSGLNPILAYQQGGATSAMGASPSGSQAVMQNPEGLSSQLLSSGIQSSISSGFGAYEGLARTEQAEAQADLIRENVKRNETLMNLDRALEGKAFAETDNAYKRSEILQQELSNLGITEQQLRAQLQMMMKEVEFSDATLAVMKANPELRIIAAVMETLGFRSRYLK